MIKTENLGLPIYNTPETDIFNLADWNEANRSLDTAYKEVIALKTEIPLLNSNAEAIRNNNETTRISSEAIRISNESSRQQSESERRFDESLRKTNETTRISNEGTRTSKETLRLADEVKRVSNEEDRKLKETQRVTSETARISAETTRVNSENTRVTNENARKTVEAKRVTDEDLRKVKELDRISSEDIRKAKELERLSSEELRKTNELARQTVYEEIEDSRKDFNGKVHTSLDNRLDSDMSYVADRFNDATLLSHEDKYITAKSTYDGFTSGLKINGRTIKNELNYNPITWEEWTKNSINTTVDATGVTFTTSDIQYVNLRLSNKTNFKPLTNYGILYEVVSSNIVRGLKVGNDEYGFRDSDIPSQVGNQKSKTTTNGTKSLEGILFYTDLQTSGNKIKIKDIRVYELPTGSEIETDFNNLTADQLASKYPFARGIQSVGEESGKVEVLSCGKNLFDKDKLAKSLIEQRPSFCSRELFNGKDCIKLTRGMGEISYRYSQNKVPHTLSISMYSSEDVPKACLKFSTYISGGAKTWGKATQTSDNNSIVILNYQNDFCYIDLDSIQLEEGTVATAYESYKEDKITVPLTEPLRSLPNGVYDEIIENKLIRRVGKVVFDGSESGWVLDSNTLTDTLRFIIPMAIAKSSVTILSNFSVTGGSSYGIDKETIQISSSVLYMRILKTKLATQDVAGFKAWLKANPVTVYYELATPIETPLDIQTSLRTYDNITHIYTQESLIEPTVQAKIPSNVNAIISTLKDENEELVNEIEENNILNVESSLDQDLRLTKLELGVM